MALIQPFGLVQDDEATRAKDDVDARKRDQRAQESEEEGAVPTPAAGRRDAVFAGLSLPEPASSEDPSSSEARSRRCSSPFQAAPNDSGPS